MIDRLSERVLDLEKRLSAVQYEIDAAGARAAIASAAPQMRIARITGDPGTGDNTFDVIFEDGYFTELAGQRTPDYYGRQTTSRAVVHNLAGSKIDSGTRVPAWFWSDRWWTWWTSGGESQPPGDPRMCGFNDILTMATLTYNENRVATWDADELVGAVSGLEWDADNNLWEVEVGDWLIEWGIQGHASCSFPTPYPGSAFQTTYLYANLEYRAQPTDEEPDPTWEAVPNARLYAYAHFGGYWNSGDRRYLLRLPDDPKQLRMICGTGQSSASACASGHIYDGWWHWTKVECG